MGGENVLAAPMIVLIWGSSPRGRGKRSLSESGARSSGLIPAWAGKTDSMSGVTRWLPAHPRVGGEKTLRQGAGPLMRGSSPRRIARASSNVRWAHPRVGGENPIQATGTPAAHGSSPRGRGKR